LGEGGFGSAGVNTLAGLKDLADVLGDEAGALAADLPADGAAGEADNDVGFSLPIGQLQLTDVLYAQRKGDLIGPARSEQFGELIDPKGSGFVIDTGSLLLPRLIDQPIDRCNIKRNNGPIDTGALGVAAEAADLWRFGSFRSRVKSLPDIT
jgi:hypothetical protein